MSDVVSAPVAWSSEKTVGLPRPKRHRHNPSPVSPGFVAPTPGLRLSFSPIALAGAIARTATTREDAPVEMVERKERNALSDLEYYIQDGQAFELSPNIEYLIDTERTHFAGQVGSGIAHLYMESLGYRWRANAECLTRRKAHGDFLYHGGNVDGHGVVLAEAHGSLSAQVTQGKIDRECEGKYLRQVKRWVGETSPHGLVVHGYSIAFGCRPGMAGALVALGETRINKPRRRPADPLSAESPGPSAAVPTSMALTTHRSNFLLMGARPVAKWIDWVRGAGELPESRDPIEFLVLRYAGRQFLAASFPFWPSPLADWLFDEIYHHPFAWRHWERWRAMGQSSAKPLLGWFVIEEGAGSRFLTALSAMIRDGQAGRPARLELPTFEPQGFRFGGDERALDRDAPDYDYALFCDGLALLGTPSRDPIVGSRVWSPKEGLQ